jgi:tetratricopeptide (TPR) repeat protein
VKYGVLLCAVFFAFCSSLAQAQNLNNSNSTDLLGQIFLPGGDPPKNPIRFLLKSEDGMMNDSEYTDSNGRFAIANLDNRRGYTIVIEGDGDSYGDTTYQLPMLSGRKMRVTVDLSSPERKPSAPGNTISAASGYKPSPKAQSDWDRAQKEIQKNRLDQAESLLREAISTDPKFAAASNDLGALLMREKRYPDAETALRQSVEADPKFINALLNLGITLNHEEKYSEAVAPLREALRLEPRLNMGHLHLGIALVGTDQFSEAERELLIARKASPGSETLIHLYMGQLYARTGRLDESITEFEAYLQRAPDSPNATAVRSAIERMQRKLPIKP